MNIYSTAHSVEVMRQNTRAGKYVEDGDYLAWGDMEWILHGRARIETVDKEEPCKEEPYVNLYYTPFPGMEACMHHCENLGTRVPSVANSQDWATLQHALKKSLYDKGFNPRQLWLPIDDKKTEGK